MSVQYISGYLYMLLVSSFALNIYLIYHKDQNLGSAHYQTPHGLKPNASSQRGIGPMQGRGSHLRLTCPVVYSVEYKGYVLVCPNLVRSRFFHISILIIIS